jgi:hypothetical protein
MSWVRIYPIFAYVFEIVYLSLRSAHVCLRFYMHAYVVNIRVHLCVSIFMFACILLLVCWGVIGTLFSYVVSSNPCLVCLDCFDCVAVVVSCYCTMCINEHGVSTII